MNVDGVNKITAYNFDYCSLLVAETKELVDIKKPDANGLAVFSNLTNDPDAYFAVALTDLYFEAIAFDKLTAS